jgi:hypothetical protein
MVPPDRPGSRRAKTPRRSRYCGSSRRSGNRPGRRPEAFVYRNDERIVIAFLEAGAEEYVSTVG